MDQNERLVKELCKLPAETGWVEFKHNKDNPEMIGELISALSNTAALEGKETAYLVWGIEDGTHDVVGTSFDYVTAKKGNQELESWLVQMLQPRILIKFSKCVIDDEDVVILEIPAAQAQPTSFSGKELVRVGSVARNLKEIPERERELWRRFDKTPFERQTAMAGQSKTRVLEMLDWQSYYELTGMPPPLDDSEKLACLNRERIIKQNEVGDYDITNLGAILLAREIGDFETIARKATRLVFYEGRTKINAKSEMVGRRGYAAGFSGLMQHLSEKLPSNEIIGKALRKSVPMFPELALRELVANALIHQDFTISGAGPMIEVFDDRIEITNPGRSLGDIVRLLDQAPRSRNEGLAAFMRRIGICEERGSGVDKVVFETETFQLPPPRWEETGDAFRAILFAPKDFKDMDRWDKIHACYLHACLRHVMRDPMNNSSLRERFGIEKQNSATVSRVIKEALDEDMIRPYSDDQGKRNARYIPFWAA